MIPTCEYVPLEPRRASMVGWRCWFVMPGEALLRPIYKRGIVWKPRQAMEAICSEETHEVPEATCKCGVWAVTDPKNLREVRWVKTPPEDVPPLPGVLIVGQVAMWGRIVEHERGLRSSLAYPKYLYAFTEDIGLAATLRDKYLVPVEYGERADLLREQLLPRDDEEEAPSPPPSPTSGITTQQLTAALIAPGRAVITPAKPTPKPPPARTALMAVQAVCLRLPAGALRERVGRAINNSSFPVSDAGESNSTWDYYKRDLAHYRARYERAKTRGAYRWRTWGDRWREMLLLDIRQQMDKLATMRTATRALASPSGDAAAQRLAWVTLARRWREAQTTHREFEHLQRLMQPVEQTGAGAQGKKPFLFKASVSSQSKYDFGDCALLAAASALPLTAPKENPGGNINPFCEPATVTSTPHSS